MDGWMDGWIGKYIYNNPIKSNQSILSIILALLPPHALNEWTLIMPPQWLLLLLLFVHSINLFFLYHSFHYYVCASPSWSHHHICNKCFLHKPPLPHLLSFNIQRSSSSFFFLFLTSLECSSPYYGYILSMYVMLDYIDICVYSFLFIHYSFHNIVNMVDTNSYGTWGMFFLFSFVVA